MGNQVIKDIQDKLRAPFQPSEIEWRVGATNKETMKGIALAYVTNRAIMNRLDEVCGIDNWKNEFIEWKDKSQLCGISIRLNGEWITKWDGANDSNKDAIKGGLSGAMKRCAAQWGIGRYLYDIPNQWYKIKPSGTSFKLAETPKLPDFALPEAQQVTKPWEVSKENDLSEPTQKCLKAFEELKVTQAELENFLQNEAVMFTDTDIEKLKHVYLQIRNGTPKEDFFFAERANKKQNTQNLQKNLENYAKEEQ